MNDAGQTAVDHARFEYDMARSTAIALVRGSSDRARAEKTADAAFDRLAAAIREADPRREAVETALVEAIRTVLEAVDEGDDDIVVPADILSRLRAALKAVEQASLSDTEEGGRA